MLEKFLELLTSIAASLATIAASANTRASAPGELGLTPPATEAPATGKGKKGAASTASAANPASSTPAASGASSPPASASAPTFKQVTDSILALSQKTEEQGGGRPGVMKVLNTFLPDVAKPTVPMLEALNKHQEIIDFASGAKVEEDNLFG